MPRQKTSIRPKPQDTAAGSEFKSPPKDPHDDHPPTNHRCQSVLSVPRTKTSSHSGALEHVVGPEVHEWPRLLQSDRHTL